MPRIPLSNRTKSPQVVRQPRGDVGGAGRGWNAVAQAGQVLGQVGSQIAEYKSRKNSEVVSAEVNRASAELQEREKLKDEQLGRLSKTGSKDSIQDVDVFHKKTEEDDSKWKAGLNLSKEAKAIMQERFDIADIRSTTRTYGAGGYADKAQINFAISETTAGMLRSEQGKTGINPDTGEEETYVEAWERHAQKKVDLDPSYTQSDFNEDRSDLESRRSYWSVTEKMAATKEQIANGVITESEALEEYSTMRDELKDLSMNVNSEAQVNATLSARIANGTFAQNKTRDRSSKAALKAVENGEFDFENITALEGAYGEDAAKDIVYGLVQQKAPSDDDIMSTLVYLDGFIAGEGDKNVSGLFKLAKKTDSSTAQMALYFANDYINDLERDKGSVVAYKTWGKSGRKNVTVNKEAGQFMRATMFYAARSGDEGDVSSTVTGKVKEYVKWKDSISDRPDDEKTFKQFFQKTFRADASQFILQAPIEDVSDEDKFDDLFGAK